jgi:hypothetical protein
MTPQPNRATDLAAATARGTSRGFLRRQGRCSLTTTALLALLSLSLATAPGCAKKKKKPPPPPPPPPVVEAAPEPIDMSGLLAEMKPDARVKFASETSPADRTLAEGVVRLADYIAKGDSSKLKSMLDRSGQTVLDELVSVGAWSDETKKIEQVRVVYLSDTAEKHPDSATVGMAIQDPAGAYLLGWTLKREGEGAWTVSAAPTPPDAKPRASDFDGQRISAASTRPAGEAPSGDAGDSDRASSEKKAEAPAAEKPAEGGDRIKRTPAGPIKIPGGG